MNLRKLTSALVLTVLIGGSAMAVQGCFEEYGPGPGYGYGYAPSYYPYGPSYGAPGPMVYGDWDEHHAWHDQDWWLANRRPWVEEHHHEWLAGRLGHEYHEHLAHESHEHEWH